MLTHIRTTNSKSENEGKRQNSERKDANELLKPISIPNSRHRKELDVHAKTLSELHFEKDGWVDPFLSLSQYTKSPFPFKDPSNSRDRSIPVTHQSSPKDIRRVEGSPPLRPFARSSSPATSTITRTRKSSFSSTSTLFESSSTVPITIVVTTPTEEFPGEDEGNSAGSFFPGPSIRKFRNDSTMSLPAIHTPFVLDRNLLMPPINSQVDTRRMRKAREFEDIRHFLIGFLNTKGSQLPRTLRTRIMSVYGITDANLDPKIVAKFGGEGMDLDEGIVLDLGLQQGAVPTDRDHKRILELAFQSVLPPATPNQGQAQDILAARRKRMSMPLRTASLYSVDSTFSTSSLSSQMSLSTNNKSKQTLDSIISNRALSQGTKRRTIPASPASSPPRSPKSQPPTSSSSFFKRRSLQVQPQPSTAQTTLVRPQPQISPPVVKTRPQSLYRNKTDPIPAKVSPPAPKLPQPTFNQNFSKSRHHKTESSPSLSSLSHKPAVSSHLSRSPLTASFPQRPLSLVQERQNASIDLDSSPNSSDQETEKDDSPTDSPDALYMKSSWISPPPPPTAVKHSIHPAAKTFHELKRTSKQIPKPIIIAPISKSQERSTQLPSPMTPTHTHTHKALTRSEVSDLEKPFYVRSRRSSSTLDAVSPKSPTLPSSQLPVSGYEFDSPGLVFPSHPAFAPLERERSRPENRKREDHHYSRSHESQGQKWGNSISVTVSEKPSSKLKKDKKEKEKRGSIFGNLKRSLFGRG